MPPFDQLTDRQRRLALAPCRTPEDLHRWVRLFTGMSVPREAVCPGHAAPFDYLQRAYFEPSADQVVWAPRGGGKTRLAALATLLDLLHKPGVAVRILGGSLEQSLKMWDYLTPDLQRLAGELLEGGGRAVGRRVALRGGSTAAVLTQSQRAVRGLRVQKLRCDEVELFKPDVWEAAQLVTKSKKSFVPGPSSLVSAQKCDLQKASDQGLGTKDIFGTVEALSTLHAPYGLMSRVVADAERAGVAVVRWCLLEVLERCEASRDCGTCPLWDDCGGVAKERCAGFLSIDDAIAMKRRVSREAWESEMLCRRPSVKGCVFPGFDEGVHVREESPVASHQSPVQKESIPPALLATDDCGLMTLALDFGFANPFVCLWIATSANGTTHVVDEYVQPQRTLAEHVDVIRSRPWKAARVACDPAGAGRSDQTASSNVAFLRREGFVVRHRPSRIVDGLERVRAALRPASGPPTLFVHPRCERLIRALRSYRYPPGGGELPVKDGEHDHLIDALRYHFVNEPGASGGAGRRY